uniref:Nuclear nucleic acid-binding protein C1D n=1 Tax=Monodelphis domestica TaxID=13616 RepID=F7GBA7_MONDO
MAEEDTSAEDYPTEIHDYLSAFENSLRSVDEMLKTMMSVSRNELLQKLDPLEQAKLDLVSAYTLNSMFWVYLATQGVNPKEHPVKQEIVSFGFTSFFFIILYICAWVNYLCGYNLILLSFKKVIVPLCHNIIYEKHNCFSSEIV